MIRLLLLSISVMWLSACSTSATNTRPAAPVATTATSPAPNGPSSTVDAEDAGTDSTDIIVVADVPQVVATEAVVAAPPKKVCKRVRPTGSHRTQRICFTESELARSTDDAREVFGELHRQQERPNGN